MAEDAQRQRRRIVLISPQTGSKTRLTDPPETSIAGDTSPSFSPDGTRVAFVRTGGAWNSGELWIQSLEGDELRQLTFEGYAEILGLTWTSDGQEIIFSAAEEGFGQSHLFRIPVKGGTPQVVTAAGMGALFPCIRGDRLVFVKSEWEGLGIWRIPGPNMKEERDPERIIQTNPVYKDRFMKLSPNGQKIAFTSTRTGTAEVWTSQTDGSDEFQLTRQGGTTPAWSPDGQRIAFVSFVEGNADVYVVDAEGGQPKRLTLYPKPDIGPSWSHDGRWIYFSSGRSGTGQIWKKSPEGGEAIQVTQKGRGLSSCVAGWSVYLLSEEQKHEQCWMGRTTLADSRGRRRRDRDPSIPWWVLGYRGGSDLLRT